MMLKKLLLLVISTIPMLAFADTYNLSSPNGRISVALENGEKGLSYSVKVDNKSIIEDSALGLIIDDAPLGGAKMNFLGETRGEVRDSFELFAGRAKQVKDFYNSGLFQFASASEKKLKLNLAVRIYDEGVAIRYILPNQAGLKTFTIQNELTRFSFAADYTCYGLNLGKFANSHEGEFDPIKSSFIREHNLYDNPLVCKTGIGQGVFALAESDVRDYPGSWFMGRGDGGWGVDIKLTPRFDSRPDGLEKAAVRATMSAAGVQSPWRVIMLGDTPGSLTESSLIAALGAPSEVKDTSWIKPGKVAWDWWNDNQVVLEGTDVKPGMNTETYKAYIDFAATLGLEYILIDSGWHEGAAWTSSPGADLIKPIPAMDMPEIFRYAKSKNVGVWLWVQWQQLDWQMEEALSTYNKWGVKGIKVDFMDRSDQEMVAYYHKLLQMTAKYQIMVNLHGAYPPNGLVRTYPHFLTQEGVMGAEYNKWSARVTATHNVTLPFTRMILGPIDYTPGGFRHTTPEEFPALRRNTLPYVKTTRGHGLAMFVVYDSPLQMLADSPITYSKTDGKWPQPENEWADGLEFIKDVPVTWDETKIIQGDIGQYIISARRKGSDWYIGAMTNEMERNVKVPLDFLGEGLYTAVIWEDGKNPSSVVKKQVNARSHKHSLKLSLAPSGGAVVQLKKQ